MPHYEYHCRKCKTATLYLLADDRTMKDEQAKCIWCKSGELYLTGWFATATDHVVHLKEENDELRNNIRLLESGQEPWHDPRTKAN